jgi:hypothetical protein
VENINSRHFTRQHENSRKKFLFAHNYIEKERERERETKKVLDVDAGCQERTNSILNPFLPADKWKGFSQPK